uniref:Lipocalin/cytosolic fatty-acid binding domain-containing protein n=1 Tax=Sus scrofa TaxID=9823 RepID=A0A8D0ZUE0_PIG
MELGRLTLASKVCQPEGWCPACPCLPLPLAATGRREIHVIDIDYEQYAILRVSHLWQGREFHVLKYFSKLLPGAGWGLPSWGPPSPVPCVPTARSLEGEYEPGFWRFRELTADTGLYLVARHGEPQAFGAGAGLGPRGWGQGTRAGAPLTVPSCREVRQASEGGADLAEPRPQPGHWEPCPPGLSWRHLPPINAAAKPAAPDSFLGGEVRGVGVDKGEPGCPEASTRRSINRCVKETTQAVKGDAPGKFKFPKEPGNKDVTVVATDYRTYAIVNVAFQKGRTAHSVLKLYSRDMEHNEKVMAHFLLEASERGLSTASVQLLLKDLTCVNLLRS